LSKVRSSRRIFRNIGGGKRYSRPLSIFERAAICHGRE
jgi:hypothetical protein